MSQKEDAVRDGGPAFPGVAEEIMGMGPSGYFRAQAWPGMTIRDYFAGQALLLYGERGISFMATEDKATLAASAYEIADAMLAARATPPSTNIPE